MSHNRALTAMIVCTGVVWPIQAQAEGYLNCETTEPELDSNPNTVLCDDFETPGVAGGHWYGEDCDRANSNGGIVARTKGWCGSIYANPITPAGASTCDGAGVGGTGCVGNHGTSDGSQGGGNMADHDFVDKSKFTEIYVRYYQKWLAGYQFGAEKVLSFNEYVGSGGIKWGNLHINCGAGAASATGALQWQHSGGSLSSCLDIATIESGVWYAIQIHAVLSTTNSSNDGLLQVWVDDCGPAGTSCSGSPTMRLNQANMSWNRASADEKFGSLWWENWANPGSTGTTFIDQVVVSKSGPIGFASKPVMPPNDAGSPGGDGGIGGGDAGRRSNGGCSVGSGVSIGGVLWLLMWSGVTGRRARRRRLRAAQSRQSSMEVRS